MATELNHKNIVLIGMPGSGKSTVGVIMAKMTAMKFVDTDLLIQSREQTTLQEIVNLHGHMRLRAIEEEVLLGINLKNHIIATGGSAAYSKPAMLHLKRSGIIVFLDASLATLKARIDNYENRGLAKRREQSFQDLFEERYALYTEFSDITIDNNNKTQEMVCNEAISRIRAKYPDEFIL